MEVYTLLNAMFLFYTKLMKVTHIRIKEIMINASVTHQFGSRYLQNELFSYNIDFNIVFDLIIGETIVQKYIKPFCDGLKFVV